MGSPKFKKCVIGEVNNNVPPAEMNTFSNAGDINNDGFIDFVVCGRNGRMVWLENSRGDGEWKQHLIDEIEQMECGGSIYDLTGSGFSDIINGGDWRRDEVLWWENPGVCDTKWERRLIAKTGNGQIHDTMIADVTNDGRMSLIFTNQSGGTNIYCIPLPEDPTVSPWPNMQVIASGKTEDNPNRWDGKQPEEGLAVGDIDGDGKNEVVCGTHWYKYVDGEWKTHKFSSGYITTKCAIGDIDGDGKNEILLSEGDPFVYGKMQGGKAAWFKPKGQIEDMWEEHVIDEHLIDAHSLQLGDICGNGVLDILIGEVGVADPTTDEYIIGEPRVMVYENDGKGNFTRHIIDQGTGTHEALLIDARKTGKLDIIGKPLHGKEKWNIHVWKNITE